MAQALVGHGDEAEDVQRFAPISISGNPVAGLSIALLEDPDGLVRQNMDMIIKGTHLAHLREGSAPETVVYFWIQGEADRQAAPWCVSERLAGATGTTSGPGWTIFTPPRER